MTASVLKPRNAGAHAAAPAIALPELLRDWERLAPRRIVMREKHLGRWVTTSWSQLAEAVRGAAAWLRAEGVGRGDVVAILGRNSAHWVTWCLASQWVGATVTAVDDAASGAELEGVLRTARPRVVVSDTVAHLEDVLLLRSRSAPSIESIVSRDALPEGVASDDVHVVVSADACREVAGTAELVEASDTDIAFLTWTSGVSGNPKPVELSWNNVYFVMRQLVHTHRLDGTDEAVSLVSYAHTEALVFGLIAALACGVRLNFPEPAAAASDIQAVRPSVLVAPHRWYERIDREIVVRLEAASAVKRASSRFWLSVVRRAQTRRTSGGRGMALPVRALAWFFLLGPLHRVVGLGRIRLAVCAGMPADRATVADFDALGVPLTRVYGLAEACMLVTKADRADQVGVGTPYPGVEVRIVPSGEIQVRSDGVARRALGPDASADEWLPTGDVGRRTPEGELEILYRLDDGAPDVAAALTRAEAALRTGPLISEAVVLEACGVFVALVELDEDGVMAWASAARVDALSVQQIAALENFRRDLRATVASTKARPETVAVADFRVLPRPLSVQDGELTATGKVRRSVIAVRHHEFVEEMTP